jgi:hypothetical protein
LMIFWTKLTDWYQAIEKFTADAAKGLQGH